MNTHTQISTCACCRRLAAAAAADWSNSLVFFFICLFWLLLLCSVLCATFIHCTLTKNREKKTACHACIMIITPIRIRNKIKLLLTAALLFRQPKMKIFAFFFVCIQKQILFIHFYCDTVVDYHSLLSLFCGWLYVVWARKFCLLWNGFLIEARENWGETMKKISVYIIGQRIAQECSFDCVAAVEMWSERRGSNSSNTKWASTKIIKPWSMIIAVARFTMHAPR